MHYYIAKMLFVMVKPCQYTLAKILQLLITIVLFWLNFIIDAA